MQENHSISTIEVKGKIFVCCPGGSVTGGPELLHQLVDSLRSLGQEAYISYFPFDRNYSKPEEYSAYNTPVGAIDDHPDNVVIVPEVLTRITTRICKARSIVWWLSVDNYYQAKGDSKLRDVYMRIKTLGSSRVRLQNLTHMTHLVQSAYAREFLRKQNIFSQPLTDYLSADYLKRHKSANTRRDIIAYNPKKGFKYTNLLIKALPEIKFVPIENMTQYQVRSLLLDAKIYIDFGNHPGKDRLPREAAILGCCVITGIRGSAGNSEDVPIPARYKLNERQKSFTNEFANVAKGIFSSFEEHAENFESYRHIISREPALFKSQVAALFTKR